MPVFDIEDVIRQEVRPNSVKLWGRQVFPPNQEQDIIIIFLEPSWRIFSLLSCSTDIQQKAEILLV